LAYRHRAIPIAWSWVKQVCGHSSGRQQLALLKYVKGLLPKKSIVFLVADSEYGSILVLRQLDQWHGFYALRQKLARACGTRRIQIGGSWAATFTKQGRVFGCQTPT
jgi:hypothetical protein